MTDSATKLLENHNPVRILCLFSINNLILEITQAKPAEFSCDVIPEQKAGGFVRRRTEIVRIAYDHQPTFYGADAKACLDRRL